MPEVLKTGGVYAENYGRAISFYVHLYRAANDEKYLRLAEGLAREAIDKLYENGLFKGHPAKPYYEACDGVGLLLWALLELDRPRVKRCGGRVLEMQSGPTPATAEGPACKLLKAGLAVRSTRSWMSTGL